MGMRDHAVFDPEAARRRQEARKKDIEEDPEQERERKDRERLESYIALLRECKAQCKRQPPTTPGGPPPLQRDPGPRLEMEPRWRRDFVELNTVYMPVSEFSGTDIGFKAMCWSLRAEQPTNPDIDACCFFWIAELFFRTSVWSCQHTIESREFWPSKQEFDKFRFRMAMVVTTYFEFGEGTDRQPSGKEGLIRAIDAGFRDPEPPGEDDPKDTEMERLGKQLMRAEIDGVRDIKARFDAMQVPPALQRLKENRRAQIELIRKRKEKAGTANAADEDEKEEVADEFKGTQWRNTSVELVRFYVPRAARLVFKYDSDEELLMRFPPIANSDAFGPPVMAHFREWILNLAVQGARLSTVTQEFRSVFCDLALPVASHTVPSRNVRTRYEKPMPYTRLKEEIGMDLASLYHDEMLNAFLPDLLKRPESGALYWDAAVLTLVNQEYRQRMSMMKENEWLKLYTVLHPDQNEQRDRLTSGVFMGYRGDAELRPVLVRCVRRFWVWYRSRLIRCSTLDEAILTMHRIVSRDFRTQPANSTFRGFVNTARSEEELADATVAERVAHYRIEYMNHNIRPMCEVMFPAIAPQ